MVLLYMYIIYRDAFRGFSARQRLLKIIRYYSLEGVFTHHFGKKPVFSTRKFCRFTILLMIDNHFEFVSKCPFGRNSHSDFRQASGYFHNIGKIHKPVVTQFCDLW